MQIRQPHLIGSTCHYSETRVTYEAVLTTQTLPKAPVREPEGLVTHKLHSQGFLSQIGREHDFENFLLIIKVNYVSGPKTEILEHRMTTEGPNEEVR